MKITKKYLQRLVEEETEKMIVENAQDREQWPAGRAGFRAHPQTAESLKGDAGLDHVRMWLAERLGNPGAIGNIAILWTQLGVLADQLGRRVDPAERTKQRPAR